MSVKVSICIVTYDRPAGLKRLLAGIAEQRFEKVPHPEVEVVVVDNHGLESARTVCEGARGRFPFPLRYCVEKRRGIAYARNRAVAQVAPARDFIVFVDDDEVPDVRWLDELLAVQHAHDADAVAGPVLPYFPSQTSAWVRKGSFFARPRHATGQRLQMARTGNVLVSVAAFAGLAKPFQERFALSGGEDSFFFGQLADAGGRIVWADEAIVHEWVPASRQRVGWVVRRAYRGMIDYMQLELEREGTLRGRVGRAAYGSRLIAGALLLLPVAAAYSVRDGGVRLVQTLQLGARGAGTIAAVLGRRYDEYR